MNERLRELMIEAGYAAPELAGRAQCLAELIVNECAGKLENDGMVEIAIELKDHFGMAIRNKRLFTIIKNSDTKLLGPEEC